MPPTPVPPAQGVPRLPRGISWTASHTLSLNISVSVLLSTASALSAPVLLASVIFRFYLSLLSVSISPSLCLSISLIVSGSLCVSIPISRSLLSFCALFLLPALYFSLFISPCLWISISLCCCLTLLYPFNFPSLPLPYPTLQGLSLEPTPGPTYFPPPEQHGGQEVEATVPGCPPAPPPIPRQPVTAEPTATVASI